MSNNSSEPQSSNSDININFKEVVDKHTHTIDNNTGKEHDTNNVNKLATEYALNFYNMFHDILFNVVRNNGHYVKEDITKGGRRLHSKNRNRQTFKNTRRINHLNTRKKL